VVRCNESTWFQPHPHKNWEIGITKRRAGRGFHTNRIFHVYTTPPTTVFLFSMTLFLKKLFMLCLPIETLLRPTFLSLLPLLGKMPRIIQSSCSAIYVILPIEKQINPFYLFQKIYLALYNRIFVVASEDR